MKRFTVLFLALVMLFGLAGCGRTVPSNTPDPPDTPDTPDKPDEPDKSDEPDVPINAPHFTKEELPRLDGSTATAPLAASMVSLMLGISKEEAQTLISFSRTTNSYYKLLSGDADLLIVSEGNEDVYDYREELGFEWEQTPFAIDAFVFVVNESNPVDSITVEQARKIYTGEITNWSELGGEDREIIPFQRNSGAGSQSLMEKLVMKGVPMMEPKKEYIASSMGELMEAVRGYDNSPGAIGYSVYYYAQEMRAAEGLKLLKLEGVDPEPEAIRSGAYPLTNPYYVVISADAPDGSTIRVIRDWLLSEDGQRLAGKEGYVSVMDFPTSPVETLPLVGSRWYEDYQDGLRPGDYGTLVPFAGRRLMDDWPAAGGYLYGLMTLDGKVVVDPVYVSVRASGDIMLLRRGVDGETRTALAALDGSWVTPLEYDYATISTSGAILFKGDTVTFVRSSGEAVGTYTAADMGISDEEFAAMRTGLNEGGSGEWIGDKVSVVYDYRDDSVDVVYFDLSSGSSGRMSDTQWYALSSESYPDDPAIDGASFIIDQTLGPDAPALLELWEYGATERRTYFKQDGTPLPQLTLGAYNGYNDVTLNCGLVELLELNTATYFDLDTMEVVFRTYLGYEGE